MDPDRINAITCLAWVPQGVAKEDPEKVEITKEDLAKIIRETSEKLSDLKNLDENEYNELEVEALQEDMKILSTKRKATNEDKVANEDVEMVEDKQAEEERQENKDEVMKDEPDDVEKMYNFSEYDTEEDGIEALFKLGMLTVHAKGDEDKNITEKEEDSESEKENQRILPSDNLIAVGHVDGDAAVLEVYVYNSEEGSLYVHHDILLPSIPLCMEWLNFDPEDENLKPGNLVAVGSMSPIIDIWDLDVVDSLEPAFVLGRKPKKKKKVSRIGHSDAVLCLGWNRDLEHILASGSVDKSLILWDLQGCKESQKYTDFSGGVQDMKWHPKENHFLLTGSSDKNVRLFDFSTENHSKKWKLDGEVEKVIWDPAKSFNCYACTDIGSVYALDVRQEKPLQRIQAHSKSCTGMVMNPQCPGCLVTVSEETTVKIWDVSQPKAKLVEERQPKIGIIHTISCSMDSPFVLSFGGDNRVDNFRVWDMRRSRKVRQCFYDRLGLPIDDGENENDDNEAMFDNDMEDEDEYFATKEGAAAANLTKTPNTSNWTPKKKSRKKKGGHLDRKKWR